MKNKAVRLLAIALCISFVGSVIGCGKTEAPVVEEKNQNDYRGAVIRSDNVQTDCMSIIQSVMEKNSSLENERPSNYWSSESYQYLTTDNKLIHDENVDWTSYFNEVETDWATAESTTLAQFYDEETGEYSKNNATAVRNKEHDYTLTYSGIEDYDFLQPEYDEGINLDTTTQCNFDANHDWLMCVKSAYLPTSASIDAGNGNNGVKTNLSFFEYAHDDKIYVMQSDTKRLYVEYAPYYQTVTKEVKNPETKELETVSEEVYVGDGIKSFYFSELDGQPLEKYSSMKEQEDIARKMQSEASQYSQAENFWSNEVKEDMVTEEGYVVNRYNRDEESIFNNLRLIDKDWAFSLGSFKQQIVYEDGILTATILNKFNKRNEIFKFYSDGSCTSYFENLKEEEAVEEKDTVNIYSDGQVYWTDDYDLSLIAESDTHATNDALLVFEATDKETEEKIYYFVMDTTALKDASNHEYMQAYTMYEYCKEMGTNEEDVLKRIRLGFFGSNEKEIECDYILKTDYTDTWYEYEASPQEKLDYLNSEDVTNEEKEYYLSNPLMKKTVLTDLKSNVELSDSDEKTTAVYIPKDALAETAYNGEVYFVIGSTDITGEYPDYYAIGIDTYAKTYGIDKSTVYDDINAYLKELHEE